MPGAVLPLPSSTPLAAVLELARPGEVVGVWIDIPSAPRPTALRVPSSPRCISLVLSADLGSLLACAEWILVGGGETLRRAAAPALRSARHLELETSAGRALHALDGVTPEGVLAERRSLRRIVSSRVQYVEPVDVRSGASLG
ncbi:MAG: hypothetical protein ACM357_04285 [Gemmatimonadota bacterium]